MATCAFAREKTIRARKNYSRAFGRARAKPARAQKFARLDVGARAQLLMYGPKKLYKCLQFACIMRARSAWACAMCACALARAAPADEQRVRAQVARAHAYVCARGCKRVLARACACARKCVCVPARVRAGV